MNAAKVVAAIVASGLGVTTYAQSPPPGDNSQKAVTWEQYQEALRRIEALERAAAAKQDASPAADSEEQLNEIYERVDQLESFTDSMRQGTTDFLVTGYAFAGFSSKEDNTSSFEAAFSPIFLWDLSDRLNFASEIEFELGESDGSVSGSSDVTEANLEFMELSYVINDYLTIRAGKLLTPLSTFKEQLHPAWINKLPSQPLFATGSYRLIPTSSLGVEARGAIPLSDSSRVYYSTYVANGPKLITSGSKTGQLNFSNFSDINNDKSVGGRIGFYPIPELDVSYAFNYGSVGASGTTFEGTSALLQDISLGYVIENEAIGGRLSARAEFVLSDVQDASFGGSTFNNSRSGGYGEIAYRPTMAGSFLKDLEGVIRYDWLSNPSDAAGISSAFDEQRITIGVDYWINPSSVFKVAYQFDDVDDPTASREANDSFMLQFAMGF